MKKRILLPTSFFFSVLFTVFLLGFMIGMIGISVWKFKNPDSNRNSNSENHKNSEENEAIVIVDKVLDGDTIYVQLDDNLKKKLGDRFEKEKLQGYRKNKKISDTEIDYKKISYKQMSNTEISDIVIIVRIYGIDAPEDKYNSLEKSFYATEAKDVVEDQIMNKSHQCIKINWDNFPEDRGRLLAYVYTQNDQGKYDDEKSLNELMLQEGYAHVYRRTKDSIQHSKEKEFENLENEAKREHKGVWNIDEKIKFQKEQGIIPSEESNTYIIIGNYFHREWCDKVTDSNVQEYQKEYQYDRKKIAKSHIACSRCNP